MQSIKCVCVFVGVCLCVCVCACKNQRLEFRASAAERKGFFEVIFDQMLTFELFLMDQDEELWTAKITKGNRCTQLNFVFFCGLHLKTI